MNHIVKGKEIKDSARTSKEDASLHR